MKKHVKEFRESMQKLVDDGGIDSISISSPLVNDGEEIIIAQKKKGNVVAKENVISKHKRRKLKSINNELKILDESIATLSDELKERREEWKEKVQQLRGEVDDIDQTELELDEEPTQ